MSEEKELTPEEQKAKEEEQSKASYHILDELEMRPKLVQCIQAHNEEHLIQYTMGSIYDAVDKILVIEGATIARPNRTEDGHSVDATVEKILEFIEHNDPDDKVELIQQDRPFVDLEEIKNTFLRFLDEGDWMIINDVDEFYRPEDIHRLRELIDIYPQAREFVPLFLHFYRDMMHIKKADPEHQPQHQRIIKYYKGMHYRAHPVMSYPNAFCSYFDDSVQPYRFVLNDMYIWHLGFIKDPEEQKAKAKFYEEELAKHGDRGVESHLEKTEQYLNHTEDLTTIARYTGVFPQGLHALMHAQLDEDAPYILKVINGWHDPFYHDKQFDEWDNTQPYCLAKVPQIWVMTITGQRDEWGNQVGQAWRE